MSNYVNITASVGKNGINKIEDVYPVQILLNKFIIPGCMKPTKILQQDGDVGNKTITTIKDFQRRIVGLSNPDGRVDPGGKTIKALNGPLKWASAATHSAESTKEWALGLGAIKSGLIEFDLVNRASATMKKLVVRNTGITPLTISKNLHDRWVLFSTSITASFDDFNNKPVKVSKSSGGGGMFSNSQMMGFDFGSFAHIHCQTVLPNNGCLGTMCKPVPIPYPSGVIMDPTVFGLPVKNTPTFWGTASLGDSPGVAMGVASGTAMGPKMWTPPAPSQVRVLLLAP